jgi:tetratricopeptide (TPR) repeat protein
MGYFQEIVKSLINISNGKVFKMMIYNRKSRISWLVLTILFSVSGCNGQIDYVVSGDQNLMLAKTSAEKDSINKALKVALAAYTNEIEFNPGSAHAYSGRGEAKFMLGDYRGAIIDCRKSTELDPAGAEAYCIQGRAEQAVGDFRSAIREYGKAIDINPHHSAINLTYYYRGNAKSESGNDAAAILDYNKSMEITPDASAYLKRGISKMNIVDKKGACLDWSKAKELGSQQADEMIRKYCK